MCDACPRSAALTRRQLLAGVHRNARWGAIPSPATTYYIHDVALLPAARGKGYAAQITDRLIARAREAGFDNLSLVTVNKSQVFWEKAGFRVIAVPDLRPKLASYGPDAALMVRDVGNL